MAKILLIDDSSFTRNIIKKHIKTADHETFEADNAANGMKQILEHKPDVILLDLVMPDVDGLEFLDKMKEKNISIPTIIVTADIQKSVTEDCLKKGAKAVLHKPVQGEEILKEINKLLP